MLINATLTDKKIVELTVTSTQITAQCKILLTECDEGHDEDLGALSKEHREQHSFPGRTEYIPMDLLPP